MTTSTRLERNLPAILGDLSAAPTPEYLDDVFVRTGRMRQRPAWTFPGRWLPMADITRSRAFAYAPPWRLIALALVVLALVAAALLYAGSQQRRVPAPFGPARNGLIPYEQGGDIYLGDPITGTSRLVLGGPETDGDPGYSPDGTVLAFARDAGYEATSILTIHPDGSDARLVTPQPLNNLRWAWWAPDSRHLAVIDVVDGHNRLQMIDGIGQDAPRRLAADREPDSAVFRPPYGNEILFRDISAGMFGLYVMNADGSNIRELIAPADMGDLHLASLAYSADGSRIFFQRASTAEEAAATGYPGDLCCKLWVMNADGTDAHEFTGASGQRWDGLGQPSPDGRWVAFWHVTGQAHVAVMKADGTGQVTDISPSVDGNAGFTWSPDSTKVLMVPIDDPAQKSYLLDPGAESWTTIPWKVPVDPDWQRLAND